jgi:hypothetical protein
MSSSIRAPFFDADAAAVLAQPRTTVAAHDRLVHGGKIAWFQKLTLGDDVRHFRRCGTRLQWVIGLQPKSG